MLAITIKSRATTKPKEEKEEEGRKMMGLFTGEWVCYFAKYLYNKNITIRIFPCTPPASAKSEDRS
jgi:hypothetical protein